jgi:hypothetical protein
MFSFIYSTPISILNLDDTSVNAKKAVYKKVQPLSRLHRKVRFFFKVFSALYDKVHKAHEIFRFGYDKVYVIYTGVLEHLGQRYILAERGFEIESVPLGRDQLYAAFALVKHFKKPLRIRDVLDLHNIFSFHSSLNW